MNSLYLVSRIVFVSFFLLFYSPLLLAQPVNDNCSDAIRLDNLDGFCSETAAFSNINATDDEDMSSFACIGENNQDVWFKFIVLEPNITITVIGETGGNLAGGSLRNPAVELYFAPERNCDNELEFIECATDEAGIGLSLIHI